MVAVASRGTLPLWVAVFALAPWAAVLVLRPVLYDEERHLLFAMPLVAVGAALGLRGLAERVKVGLSWLVLASALLALASWGKYAYVYKDPILLGAANEDFMGDYWGAASGAMAQALYDHVPERLLRRGDDSRRRPAGRARATGDEPPRRRSACPSPSASRTGALLPALSSSWP